MSTWDEGFDAGYEQALLDRPFRVETQEELVAFLSEIGAADVSINRNYEPGLDYRGFSTGFNNGSYLEVTFRLYQ